MRIRAAVLALALATPLRADDRASGPVIQTKPTLNTNAGGLTTPIINTNVSNVNTINTQTGVSDFNGPTANPTGPEAQLSGPNQAQLTGPGAQLIGPQAQPTGPHTGKSIAPSQTAPVGDDSGPAAKIAAPNPAKTTPQSLNKAIEGMAKPESTPTGANATGDAAAELSHVFDSAGKYDAKVAGPGDGGLIGSASSPGQVLKNSVVQNVRIANEPSTHPADVPGLYLAGLAAARKAADTGLLSKETAAAVVQKVTAFAAEKAKTSLGELANTAYQAAATGGAGEHEVERAVGLKEESSDIGAKPRKPGAFDQWQELLGQDGKPLVSNLGRLKKDVWRAQEEAAKEGPSTSRMASRVVLRVQDGAYFAVLPNSSVSRLPELSAQLSMGPEVSAAAVSDLSEYEREPTLANAFRVVRRRAGLAAAITVWVKGAVMTVWQKIVDGIMSLLGRTPEAALAKLGRPASAEESQAADGGRAVFVDYAKVNGPYLAAQRILSRSGELTVAQARKALALAAQSADAGAAITGHSAGISAVASLNSRVSRLTAGLSDSDALPLSAAAMLVPGEGGGLSAWLDRIQASAMERLDAGALKTLSKQSDSAQIYADLKGQAAMIRVYFKDNGHETAAGLSKLGFRIEQTGGSAVAIYDWDSGLDATASLTNALSVINSPASKEAQPTADEAAISRVVTAYLGHSGKDRLADFEAIDPALSQFAPAEIVEKGAKGFMVERARRKLDGKLQDLYLLRDLRTRRPVFGAAVAIPAH